MSSGPSLCGEAARVPSDPTKGIKTMARRYGGDPYWLTARFASVCSCGKRIEKGERGFFYPNGRRMLCAAPCGEKADREFQSAKQDEAFMGGGAF